MTIHSHRSCSIRTVLAILAGAAVLAPNAMAWAQPTPVHPLPVPVPVPPPIPNGNHYQCYTVTQSEPSVPRAVVLSDQFGKRKVMVYGVTKLCTPTAKSFQDREYKPVDPRLHILCYRLGPAQQATRLVRVRNQFGTVTLKVGQPTELCLPSAKQILK